MKTKIALLLLVVMLVGCVFAVPSFAEEASAVSIYKPEITYTNIAYTEGLVVMFAVPATASLADGEKLEVLVWDSRLSADAFSYNDAYRELLSAEADKATIGGVEHYVYKYDKLTAQMMTDVIYARPVYTDSKGLRTYGDVIDYSVVEYVKVANGEFDGFAGLAEDKKNVLNSLLNFGATAQIYLGDDGDPYTPNGYLANDTLNKLWIVPVVGGVEQEKVFAGFFKYEEGVEVTVNAPIYDSYIEQSYVDLEGNPIEDVNAREAGLQIIASNGDITVKCNYTVESFNNFAPTAADLAAGAAVDNLAGNSFDFLGFGKVANLSNVLEGNKYHSFRVVADPTDETNAVVKWTANYYSALYLTAFKNSQTFPGFGDTVYPVITVEVEFGRVNGKIITTGGLRLRHDLNGQNNINIFSTSSDGTIYLNVAQKDDNGQYVFMDKGAVVTEGGNCRLDIPVGVVAEEGMSKFAFTFDFRTGMVYGYAEDENGEMKLTASGEHSFGRGWYNLVNGITDRGNNHYAGIEDWAVNNSLSVQWMGGANWLSEYDNAVVNVGGVDVPVKEGGEYNTSALVKYSEEHCAMLIDNFKISLGALYEN